VLGHVLGSNDARVNSAIAEVGSCNGKDAGGALQVLSGSALLDQYHDLHCELGTQAESGLKTLLNVVRYRVEAFFAKDSGSAQA
jgi:hypothetical protein